MSGEQTPVTPAQEPEQFQSRVPESKRLALLRYMIIMFAMAFVLVLLSMVLQTKSSNQTITHLHNSSASAITRAEELQDENRELEEKLAQLSSQLLAEQSRATAAETQLEDLQKQLAAAETQQEDQQKRLQAAATLIRVLAAAPDAPEAEADRLWLRNNADALQPELRAIYEAWLQRNNENNQEK